MVGESSPRVLRIEQTLSGEPARVEIDVDGARHAFPLPVRAVEAVWARTWDRRRQVKVTFDVDRVDVATIEAGREN